MVQKPHLRLWPGDRSDLFFFFCIRVQVLLYTPVNLAVPYMLIELAGCLVDPRINCNARKLTRISRITKKKKKTVSKCQHNFNLLEAVSRVLQ
jgi:hypothetical protein